MNQPALRFLYISSMTLGCVGVFLILSTLLSIFVSRDFANALLWALFGRNYLFIFNMTFFCIFPLVIGAWIVLRRKPTPLTKMRICIWIIFSFLTPFLFFILLVIYSSLPTFGLSSMDEIVKFDIASPWIASVVGLVLYLKVFRSLVQVKSRATYSLFYFFYLLFLTHASLTFSFNYNKVFSKSMDKGKFEKIIKAFPPEGVPLSQEQAIEKVKNVGSYLNYNLKNFDFKCVEGLAGFQNAYAVIMKLHSIYPTIELPFIFYPYDYEWKIDVEKTTGKILGISGNTKKIILYYRMEIGLGQMIW